MSTGNITPGSFASLSQSVFGDATPAQPQAGFPGTVPSGGTIPSAAPAMPPAGGFPPQYQQPYAPAAPVVQQPQAPAPVAPPVYPPVTPGVQYQPQAAPPAQPVTVPPQYQQQQPVATPPGQGVTPPAFAPPVAPPRPRTVLDTYVSRGQLTREQADFIGDDFRLFEMVLQDTEPQQPNLSQGQAGVTPTTPAAPVTPPTTPAAPESQMLATARTLVQQGILVDQGGFFVAKSAEMQPLAAAANQEQFKLLQAEAAKQAQTAFNPVIEQMKQQMEQLKQQVQAVQPKPHTDWIQQHREYLYAKDVAGNVTPTRTPAGDVYYRAWNEAQARGLSDESVLHEIAKSKVEGFWMASGAAAQQPAQPQQTFMQAAAAAPYSPNPGFNAPGTTISQQTPNGYNMPGVNNQGMPDWDYLMNQHLAGNPQIR